MNISELNVHGRVIKGLEKFGFETLTEVQAQSINPAIEGRDLFVRSQTGSGKTLAFGVPIINNLNRNKGIQALIVCPTRELASQVATVITKLAVNEDRDAVTTIFGGAEMSRQIKKLKSGRVKVVVGTPGRLNDHLNRGTLKLDTISTVVLDEADEMLNMGFKEEIDRILTNAPEVRQTMLFSATYPEYIKGIAKKFLNNPVNIEIGIENTSIKNIRQEYCQVASKNKMNALVQVLSERSPFLSIVFSNTKAYTEDIASHLKDNGVAAAAINGDMNQGQRSRVMRSVKEGKTSVLVATDVVARGIDINDVEYVINFDIPRTDEYFLHRVGRTGRAGKEGHAISFVSTKLQLEQITSLAKATNTEFEQYCLGELDFNIAAAKQRRGRQERENDKRRSGFGDRRRSDRPERRDDERRERAGSREEKRGGYSSRSREDGRNRNEGRGRDDNRSMGNYRDSSRGRDREEQRGGSSSYGRQNRSNLDFERPSREYDREEKRGSRPMGDRRNERSGRPQRKQYGEDFRESRAPREQRGERGGYGRQREDSRGRSGYAADYKRSDDKRSARTSNRDGGRGDKGTSYRSERPAFDKKGGNSKSSKSLKSSRPAKAMKTNYFEDFSAKLSSGREDRAPRTKKGAAKTKGTKKKR